MFSYNSPQMVNAGGLATKVFSMYTIYTNELCTIFAKYTDIIIYSPVKIYTIYTVFTIHTGIVYPNSPLFISDHLTVRQYSTPPSTTPETEVGREDGRDTIHQK